MWSSENERLGFKKCSPTGYFLVEIGFVLFVGSAISLFAAIGMIAKFAFSAGLSIRLLWFLALPVLLGFAGWGCNRVAWFLVKRKGFVYDYTSDRCTWREA